MGIDIDGYVDIQQEEVERLIVESGLDREDDEDQIVELLKKKYVAVESKSNFIYRWIPKCELHEFYTFTNFPDDERLDNPRFHEKLEKSIGQEYPVCLSGLPWSLRETADAKEVAAAIRVFFAGDRRLGWFADWLEETSKYCKSYETSH
jgi:hypothetical protein